MSGRLAITAFTHRGLKRRANEDCVRIGAWAESGEMETPVHRLEALRTPLLCGVADGLGGHEGGALASGFVMARLAREVARLDNADTLVALLRQLANDVVGLGNAQGGKRPPGTTLAALLCQPGGMRALAVNVGDSRIYRLSHRGIEQLSSDDTAPASNAEHDEDGRTGQRGHVLSQAIGGGHAPQRLVPHIVALDLRVGERYLMCTDGLTDVLGNSEINAAALRYHDDDPALIAALSALAMERGGPDNIALCLVRAEA